MIVKKYKSQGKAVEVTVMNKEENSSDIFWISSKNSASGKVKFHAAPYTDSALPPSYLLRTACTLVATTVCGTV